jgi:MFS family permease
MDTTAEDSAPLVPRAGAESLRGLPRLLAVLRGPRVRGFLAARALGSLPMGMVPLGIILGVRASGGSYALAGLADGGYAVGVAAMQPLLGRLVDRFGIPRVLAPISLLFPALLIALTLAATGGASGALTVALAFAAGAALPPVGPCMRALWPTLVSAPELRATAFAIDATLQELAFITGPVLLAALVAVASPRSALLVAAGAGGVGGMAFALRARSRHVRTHRAGGALGSSAVRRLLLLSGLLGIAFGATEVAMPAFCELHGARDASGLLLAALALGSACGGAVFGGRAARSPASRRLLFALSGYAVLVVPLLAAPTIPLMALATFASGLPIAPAFASSYLLLDRFSVSGTVTETFAWNTTCIFVGASLGTACGGALVGPAGYRASLALSVALGVVCALLAAAFVRGPRLET